MTIPVWVLLGFAGWTLLVLVGTVGVYRWSRVFSGRAEMSEFRADDVQGKGWYKRAMRAHANCVENLPVYAAIVFVLVVGHVDARILDVLALTFLGARVVHSVVHIGLEQSNLVASFRFAFFFVQLACMVGMGGYAALQAAR